MFYKILIIFLALNLSGNTGCCSKYEVKKAKQNKVSDNMKENKNTMDENWLKNLTEEQLAQEISRHNKLYWTNNAPEISDEDYDLLVRRMEELNPDNPVLHEVSSPVVASLGKVKLNEPMISLDKTYYFKDAPEGKKSLYKWAEELKRNNDEVFLIQPKYDGISANYSNGILATRGQGSEDENVSDKVPLIELETKGYKGPLDRDVRGEIIIRNDDFKTIYSKIKKKDGKPYKNSRNAVGGIMGLKDISDIMKQGAKLTLVDYSLVSHPVSFANLEEEWPKIVENFEHLPYPMDGIVVKLADKKYRNSLGSTAHHPRGQIAFKFTGIRKKTKLIDVEWSFGKNSLTPVGKIEPVEIGGVTITNVTLHNIAMVKENDWQIGDIVTVERAGDVIPHIVESEPGTERKSFILDKCPSCGHELIIDNKELRCINPECFEIKLQRILAAVKNIGIEELGEPNIRKMMIDLKVQCLKDIFNLSKIDIYSLEGFKEKSTENLYNNIQAAKDTTDYQLLAALNIEGIGQVSAGKILKDYSLKELRNMSVIQLSFILEVGPETSKKLHSALIEKRDIIDELLETLNVTESKGNDMPKELVCFDFDNNNLKKKKLNNYSYYKTLAKKADLNIVKYPTDSKTNEQQYSNKEKKCYLSEISKVTAFVTTKVTGSTGKAFLVIEAKKLDIPVMTPEEWEKSLPEISEQKTVSEKKTICFTGKMPEKRSFYEEQAEEKGYKALDKVTKDLTLLVTADLNSNSSKIKKARKEGIKVISLDEWLGSNEKNADKVKTQESNEVEETFQPELF